tara:strand:+ start:1288 stop:1830 length:543 start_codon:yes stop_codon:yes gene_type:complete
MLKIIILLSLAVCLLCLTFEKQNCRIINEQKYCINEDSDSSKFKILTLVDKNFDKLIDHLQKRYPDEEITNTLTERYKNKTRMSELLDKSKNIAFSKNKGEEVSLCLEDENLDMNTLMFIAIHELSHIGTNEIGHTNRFWKNMKFLLERAVELDIYIPQDYSKFPVTFCDYEIESSPLFK